MGGNFILRNEMAFMNTKSFNDLPENPQNPKLLEHVQTFLQTGQDAPWCRCGQLCLRVIQINKTSWCSLPLKKAKARLDDHGQGYVAAACCIEAAFAGKVKDRLLLKGSHYIFCKKLTLGNHPIKKKYQPRHNNPNKSMCSHPQDYRRLLAWGVRLAWPRWEWSFFQHSITIDTFVVHTLNLLSRNNWGRYWYQWVHNCATN